MGAKKFGMSLETREIKLFWRDIPGFCWDIPAAPEKFEKKKFVFVYWPLFELVACTHSGSFLVTVLIRWECSHRGRNRYLRVRGHRDRTDTASNANAKSDALRTFATHLGSFLVTVLIRWECSHRGRNRYLRVRGHRDGTDTALNANAKSDALRKFASEMLPLNLKQKVAN